MVTRTEFKAVLSEFTAASHKKYGSYAYATGYLESVIASMFESLTKAEKEYVMRDFKRTNEELKENV